MTLTWPQPRAGELLPLARDRYAGALPSRLVNVASSGTNPTSTEPAILDPAANFQPQEAYLAMHEHLSKLDWLFVSPTPLPDTMTLYISVTRTLRDSGIVQTSFFMIPLDRDLYSKPLTMLFDPDKLTINAHGNIFLSTTTSPDRT